jgi:glycosyltransferase involved in cell wall biosynthesis
VIAQLCWPHELVIAGRRVREYLLHADWSSTDLKGIRFLGFVPHEELPELYNLAALLVMPSFYEGFGITLLEAMASGCPAVASQSGACAEISAEASLMADPTDPADLAAKILTLLRHEALRQDLRAKGLQQASTFRWERTAKLVLNAITRVVSGSHPRQMELIQR